MGPNSGTRGVVKGFTVSTPGYGASWTHEGVGQMLAGGWVHGLSLRPH